MGSRIAARLLGAGVPVRAWNRDPRRAEPIAALGAEVSESPEAAVAGCDFVVMMLADGPATRAVLWERGAGAAMAPGTIVADMASIPAADAREHARRLAERGVAYLDAPVSGGSRGAQEGSLTIMVGGDRAAHDRAAPIFAPLGRTTHIGPSGAGQVAKSANQLIVGITIGAVAEALVLAEAAGADAAAVREALMGGFADSRILREHGERMLTGDFAPGAKVATQLKDLRTVLTLAAEVGISLPLAERITDLFARLQDTIGAELDHSSLILALRTPADGLP